MRMTVMVAVVVAVSACRHDEVKSEGPATGAGGGGAAEVKPAVVTAASPFAGLAGRVVPPPEVGASRSAVLGCAAKPEAAEQEAGNTRGGMPVQEKVEAVAAGHGMIVTHDLPHACCLSAKTTAALEGTKVTVTETLEGTPCRCLCSSTLKTAVGLSKGTWTVEVNTATPAKSWTAWSGSVEVP